MIRWILILIGIGFAFSICAQGSFSADISKAKGISEDRLDQIDELSKILIKRKYSSYPDSLGLVHYAIAYRYRILGDDINVINSSKAGVEKFKLQDYTGYQLPFLYSFLGESYIKLGELGQAIHNYQNILDRDPEGRAITVYGYAAFQLSDIYRNVEDYRTALDYIESVTNGPYADQLSDYDLMDLYLSASICYSNLEDEEALSNAQITLDKAVVTSESIDDLDTWQALELDQQQAFINLMNGEKIKSATIFERNLQAIKQLSLNDPSYKAEAAVMASNISYTYQQTGNFKKALDFANRARVLHPADSNQDQTNNEFLIYNNLSTAFEGMGELDSSLIYINKSIDLYPQSTWLSSADKKLILQGLFDKSRIVSKNSNAAEALEIILQLDKLFDRHIEDQLSAYSVRNLKAKGTEYYQFGINLAYQTKDIEAYWLLSEKMKGLQLLEANLANQANNTSVTLQSLNDIKKQILTINYLIDTNADQNILDSLQTALAAVKKQRIDLSQKVKLESNKTSLSIIEIENLQQNIENETIIQYQAGTNDMYGLAITKDNISLKKIGKLQEITNKISQLRVSIENPDSDISKLNSQAQALNELLISPFEVAGEKLVIILDERLYGLPFDILQDPSGAYLIMSSAISYTISGSFLIQADSNTKKASPRIRSIHVVRPLYKTGGSLSALPFAAKEEQLISTSYDVATADNDIISKSKIDSLLKIAGVLHYSGHAIANSASGENAYLALSGDDDIHSRLLLGELYSMNTNAQMVVLSACNTGTGRIIKGEGVESLARGFLYAGAKSVINTLWTVDDNSTATIVGDLYNHFKTKEEKSEALRNAKLDYLASAESFQRHPYYWAGIVAIGDMSPLEEYSINWPKHILLLAIFLLLAWFLTWRHSKRPFPKIEFLSDQF